MPKWLGYLLAILIVVSLGLSGYTCYRVNKLYTYMGSAQGDDPHQWKGLLGNLRQNAVDLRDVLQKLDCRVYTLEGHPEECGGPGGTVPRDPPGGFP